MGEEDEVGVEFREKIFKHEPVAEEKNITAKQLSSVILKRKLEYRSLVHV